jgi:transposase InsO family protein
VDDPRLEVALLRYQAISPYIADPPPRGQRRATLERLAQHVWTWPDGSPRRFSAETLRAWIRRYRRNGLDGLVDAPRARPGTTLDDDVLAKAIALKKEVPERTLDTLVELLELSGTVEAGTVKRSTLHRALQQRGLSRRPAAEDRTDLDRFEASFSNELWQSDMLAGPMLPDPERPGKTRRAWLYAFLDDHSRLLLHGRFAFKGDLPALEVVLRRSLQRWGVPKKLYYDNGAVYRSHHMKRVAAVLGMQGIVFTQAYRPMGHGKIEAFNRYCKRNFIAEVKGSKVQTLDQVNAAFRTWMREYNERVHGQTDQTPLTRWNASREHVKWAEEEQLRQAFLFSDTRKPDKSGLFSLHTVEFQVGPSLAKRKVEVRYDPEDLSEVEVYRDGEFQQRLRPFEVSRHRRPKAVATAAGDGDEVEGFDRIAAWAAEDRSCVDETPEAWRTQQTSRRQQQLDALAEVFSEAMDGVVLDAAAIKIWLAEHGPFEVEAFRAAVQETLQTMPADLHPLVLLDAVKEVVR